MYKYSAFLAGVLLFLATSIQAQKSPCTGNAVVDLIPGSGIRQSSYFNGAKHCEADNAPGHAQEPVQTRLERNPWLELDLKSSASLSAVQISYPVDAFMDGFQEYYILFSQFPIEHTDLAKALANPAVDHIFISEPLPAGMVIPLDNRNARYVRIQSAQESALFCSKISLWGSRVTAEIAGNSIDDDCDGRVDNTDEDAKPVFRSVLVTPGSMEGENGSITIETGGENLQYSLDGGQTFQKPADYDGNYLKIDAPAGTYNLVISNSEGAETPYQYNPVVVAAPEVTSCGNGDFSSGWAGWTGWLGDHVNNGSIHVTSTNLDPTGIRHALIQSGSGYDPTVKNKIALSGHQGNAQFARLGSTETATRHAQSLKYCFQVTQTNAQFTCWIAAVLFHVDSIDHNIPGKSSFFSYSITGPSGQIIGSNTYLPGADQGMDQYFDSFYTINSPQQVYFLPWTCISQNLTSYIGQQVCIEFTTAGCAFNGHGGYAYIDGVCNNISLPTLSMPSSLCYPGNTINATVTGGAHIGQYQWKVEKIDGNGNIIAGSTALGPLQNNFPIAPLTDVISFWQSRVSNPRVYCGQQYRVTLNVFPEYAFDCGNSNPAPIPVSVVFTANCQPVNLMTYCDLIVCSDQPPIQMQATGSCSTCQFTWSPADDLNDNTIALPTIISNAGLDQNYTLTITDPGSGCSLTNTVQVQSAILDGTFKVVSKCNDQCSIVLEAIYTSRTPLSVATVAVIATSNDPVESHVLNHESTTSLPNGSLQYKFVSEPIENKGTGPNGQIPIIYTVKMGRNFPLGGNSCLTGNCTGSLVSIISVPRGIFWQTPTVVIPSTFCPNPTSLEGALFNPVFSTGQPDPGVNCIKMQIFSPIGKPVYSNEECIANPSCSTTAGLKGNEPGFPWNGRKNNIGDLQPAGVYSYVIRYQNCSGEHVLTGTFNLTDNCISGLGE